MIKVGLNCKQMQPQMNNIHHFSLCHYFNKNKAKKKKDKRG